MTAAVIIGGVEKSISIHLHLSVMPKNWMLPSYIVTRKRTPSVSTGSGSARVPPPKTSDRATPSVPGCSLAASEPENPGMGPFSLPPSNSTATPPPVAVARLALQLTVAKAASHGALPPPASNRTGRVVMVAGAVAVVLAALRSATKPPVRYSSPPISMDRPLARSATPAQPPFSAHHCHCVGSSGPKNSASPLARTARTVRLSPPSVRHTKLKCEIKQCRQGRTAVQLPSADRRSSCQARRSVSQWQGAPPSCCICRHVSDNERRPKSASCSQHRCGITSACYYLRQRGQPLCADTYSRGAPRGRGGRQEVTNR